ncbi:MAG: GDP-mannose 4,6-dehydratase [Candidatus Lokiarchaeota archaeon]|nr:GDP-mannose 4,6-dehydratase [Candidatus Lokiarchaeota archaeon]
MSEDNLIPIEDVLEENERVKELEKSNFIIKPKKIEQYLNEFKNRKSAKPNEKTWNDLKVLITGISGFAGSHLAEHLLDLGCKVFGTIRRHAVPMYENIEHLRGRIKLYEADLTSAERVYNIIEEINPNYVFHLAAESFVPTSFREPARVINNNIVGTINIFEALRKYDNDLKKIQVACSSEQYGLVDPSEVPVIEELKINPFRPRSIYGITKVATEQIAWLYHNSYGIPSIITRGFNHEGPRRGIQFVTSVIHRQIVEILKNYRKSIIIGNPNAIRDFTHVKDTINAYILICEKGESGEPYNVCSGKGISISDYIMLSKQLYDIKADVFVDSNRLRPSEVPLLIGKNDKIVEKTGWQPERSILDIIKEGVNFFDKHPEQLGIEAH